MEGNCSLMQQMRHMVVVLIGQQGTETFSLDDLFALMHFDI